MGASEKRSASGCAASAGAAAAVASERKRSAPLTAARMLAVHAAATKHFQKPITGNHLRGCVGIEEEEGGNWEEEDGN